MQIPNDIIFKIIKHLEKKERRRGYYIEYYGVAFALLSKETLAVYLEIYAKNAYAIKLLIRGAIESDNLCALKIIYSNIAAPSYYDVSELLMQIIKHHGFINSCLDATVLYHCDKYVDGIAFMMSKMYITVRHNIIRDFLDICINARCLKLAKLLIRVGISGIKEMLFPEKIKADMIKALFKAGMAKAIDMEWGGLSDYGIVAYFVEASYPISINEIYGIMACADISSSTKCCRKQFRLTVNKFNADCPIYYGDNLDIFMAQFDYLIIGVCKSTIANTFKDHPLILNRSLNVARTMGRICRKLPYEHVKHIYALSVNYDMLAIFASICDIYRVDINNFITSAMIKELIHMGRAYHVYYLMSIGYTVTPEHLNTAIRYNNVLLFKILAPKLANVRIPIEYVNSQPMLDICLEAKVISINNHTILKCRNRKLKLKLPANYLVN